MRLGEIIKKYRKEHEVSMDAFARMTGLSKAYISILERNINPVNKKAPTPSVQTIRAVSKAIGIDFNDFLELLDDSQKIALVDFNEVTHVSAVFPVIGEVAAGYGMDAVEEETGEYEQIPVEWLRGHSREDWFVLRVKGDSMYPDFQDGDRVLVLRTSSVDSGSIAVILYDSEVATLKRVHYKYGEDWMELEPINREYVTKRINGQDLEQCRVLGQVKRLIRVVAE